PSCYQRHTVGVGYETRLAVEYRAPRRQRYSRTTNIVHRPQQLEHVCGVATGPERGCECACRDACRDGPPAQDAQAYEAGREIGGAPIALIVDDAVPPCRGPERVAPRLSAARVQIGEPEAAGTRPFRRASVAMHRLAEALQAEDADDRLLTPRGDQHVRP